MKNPRCNASGVDWYKITAKVVKIDPGSYNGPETPMVEMVVWLGTIEQENGIFLRPAYFENYKNDYFVARWYEDIKSWVIDHPKPHYSKIVSIEELIRP